MDTQTIDHDQVRAQRRAQIAELRANPRLQGLIAARRATIPPMRHGTEPLLSDAQDPTGRFMPAPTRDFGIANVYRSYGDGAAWFPPGSLRPLATIYPSGNVRIENAEAIAHPSASLRLKVQAVYRERRLDGYEIAVLLRKLADYERNDNMVFATELIAALRRDNRALAIQRRAMKTDIARLEKQVAKLHRELAALTLSSVVQA